MFLSFIKEFKNFAHIIPKGKSVLEWQHTLQVSLSSVQEQTLKWSVSNSVGYGDTSWFTFLQGISNIIQLLMFKQISTYFEILANIFANKGRSSIS